MPEKIRSFIAVDLPIEIAKKIASAAKFFQGTNFKEVSERNIHLTLKFLGSVSSNLLEELASALKETLEEEKPFSFEIGGLGAFPSESRARVIWCGVKSGSRELSNLALKVDEAALRFGFKSEGNFVPHITIGRFRRPENISLKLRELEKEFNIKSIVKVNSIKVYRSTLTPKGPVYEVLYEISLSG